MHKELIPIYLNFLKEEFPGIVPHKTCMEFLANSKIVDVCAKGVKKVYFQQEAFQRCARNLSNLPFQISRAINSPLYHIT